MKHLSIRFGATLIATGLWLPVQAQNAASELETPKVEVVATTPLPGLGTPLSQVPANVQTFTERSLSGRRSVHVADHLERQATSVNISEGQSNPYQPDVIFRGFTASPLLGTAQGLTVFQDGVRINEGFGDIVNWDLLPHSAIAGVTLLPGSNAVFGMNTIGGALSITTKSGFQYPGFAARLSSGSHGRRLAELEWGTHGESNDFYLATDAVHDNGWREHSPSSINRLFAKLGHEDETNDLDLSLNLADNSLYGTQALPLAMLDQPRQPYTWPDSTRNQLIFANLKGSHALDANRLIVGNLFYRKLDTSSFNSNVNDACNSGACDFSAFNNLTRVRQTRLGASMQLTVPGDLAGRKNQFTAGLSMDGGTAYFVGEQQPARFTADRGTAAMGFFLLQTSVRTRHNNANLYLTDTLSLTEALHLTASASYADARVSIADRSGIAPALNGTHHFAHVNPALGLAFSPNDVQTWFAGFSQGVRAPTPVELTCADPADPCQLPNIFLADPPLQPVISRTLEIGTRQKLAGGLRLNLAAYRTDLSNDIQFIGSAGAALNAGYFQNIGRTQREGMEFGLDRNFGALDLGLRFGHINATYLSAYKAHSPNNSSRDATGDIQVNPGNRFPGIPRQSLKLRADLAVGASARLGADMVGYTRQYARGDENNRDGSGPLPGYATLNLDADYRFGQRWRLFASVSNLFDRSYASFGVLGSNFFTGPRFSFDPARVRAEQFRSPGAPRSFWIGIEYTVNKQR